MTTTRLLIGPADPAWAARSLPENNSSVRWFPFGAPDWNAVAQSFPAGWSPDAVLLRIGYASVPSWVWSCPAPIVALAHDPNLLWHQYREQLPLFDLALTDAPAAERFRRAGLTNVRAANLYGLENDWLAEIDAPEGERDIDVLFVGNLHPAVQGDRLRWLGRLARLGARWKVAIRTGVFGAEYRAIVRRAKVVFNRSIRGECNLRAFEAAAGGAVLFQEADNPEVPQFLAPDSEYARYTDADLEEQLARVLERSAERRAIAVRAKEKVRGHGWLPLVRAGLAACASEWPAIVEAARRAANPPNVPLAVRVWQRASLAVGPDSDPTLATDLQMAGHDHARALFAPITESAVHLASAAAAGNRVSAVGLAAALAGLGRRDDAVAALRKVLAELDSDTSLAPAERNACPYPANFDHLRVGWDRAGWDHPDDPTAESREKLALLRCRAWSILAELTDDLDAFRRAAAARPQLPTVRAALGCALARAGQFAEAAEYLRVAVDGDPFDKSAAQALVGVLTESGQAETAERVKEGQRLLVRAMGKESSPTSASDTPVSQLAPPTHRPPGPRIATLSRDEFAERFGRPDTSSALSGFTPPHDTHAVLALVAHLRPRRLLEIGTAAGHMTANLCTWSAADAVVFSLGIVGDAPSGEAAQGYEVPKRHEFARHADHFGTAHKAMLVTADSRTYDFTRLAPLDCAFIDGGHDFDTVRCDTLAVYSTLRLGGCMVWHDFGSRVAWVKVREAIESLGFPEPVYHVAGTEVAFLFKGEGVGASPGPDLPKIAIAWDGEFGPAHSLAAVNRAVCGELVSRGQSVALVKSPTWTPASSHVALAPELAALVGRELRADATVRHRWPPDFTPPAGDGAFVLCQPWEFGRLPRAWIEPIIESVDEVWTYSRAVERCYISSGIPADRVQVVPLGVDLDRFRPGLEPLPLATTKRVKFLFVGGTIARKGFDVLLAAYRRAFTAADGVCLVVKEFGAGTFYRGQTAGAAIASFRADPNAPEIEYLDRDLSESDLARLYAACDVLVSSYRGEGFALPVLEAMACGLPVVVTAGGPTDEFVPPSAGWRIPARIAYFADDRVDGLEACGRPWWLEPDADALTAILRTAAADDGERSKRGIAARRAALGWTWTRTAAVIEDRVRALRNKTPVRFTNQPIAQVPDRHPEPSTPFVATSDSGLSLPVPFVVTSAGLTSMPATARGRPRISLTMIVKNEEHNLAACLAPVRGLVDEMIVVDTGSTDRTREIARSFGATVSEFAWIDSFSAGRNAALDRATGDWAFWMDADDRLDEANAAKLAKLFAALTYENAAYVMKCVCVADSPGGTATAVDHVRLFRTDTRHRFMYRVHEQILPALRQTGTEVRWSDVAIHHVGYVDAALRKRKLARDLRLLDLEKLEQPNDPFTLFNLGSVYNELGDMPSAVAALEASLAGSHPNDSIVRKLYALLAQCHRRIGDASKALVACRTGRGIFPDDAELLFIESNLLKEAKNPRGAEELMLRLIRGREAEHFGSVDTGLRGYKARHNLACLYFETGRHAEAESQWRAALVDEPGFVPAHIGLAELYLRTRNWPGVDRAAADLRGLGSAGEAEAESLVGRSLTARGDHAAARQVLESAAGRFPSSVAVWSAYAYALLEGGADPIEAEAALREVLKLDPENGQAKRNLEALYRNTGRWVEGVIDPPPS